MTTRTSRASNRWMVAAAAAVAIGSTLALPGSASAGPDSTPPVAERISGADRYETAVAVNQAFGYTSCEYVIASGENFPDGLASAIFYEPILLTRRAALPASTKAELDRLSLNFNCGPGGVTTYIVGGTDVVSAAQENILEGYGPSTRIAGSDRYKTAIAIANWVDVNYGDVTEVLLTTGTNFPDALAGGYLSQEDQSPILLTAGASLRADVAAFLIAEGITSVKILGGTDAVPASVATQISSGLGIPVTRIGGADRAATAVAIADHIDPDGPEDFDNAVILVNGSGFADALAAAPYAYDSNNYGPILLTNVNSIPAPTAAYHVKFCDGIEDISVVGGTAVVSNAVVAGAVGAATCPAPTVLSATLVNNDYQQTVRQLVDATLTVTVKAGSLADGAAGNALQLALIQTGGVESVALDPEGNDLPAYNGLPTIIVTANFAGLTENGFVNLWNGSIANVITTAATTDGTPLVTTTGLVGGTVGTPIIHGLFAPSPNWATIVAGSQDSIVTVTFDRAVTAAPPAGISRNLNPVFNPLTGYGAPSSTSPITPVVGSTIVSYTWDDMMTPPAPTVAGFNQIVFNSGFITPVAGASNSLRIRTTLTAP